MIEPYFDSYLHGVKLAGGIPKGVPLRLNPSKKHTSEGFEVDLKELENAFSDKTKMFIVNTPHNPLGKVHIYTYLCFCICIYVYICICVSVYVLINECTCEFVYV